MTREVWQDDPPSAVGSKCTCGNTEPFQVHSWDCASRNPSETQIAPATDDRIEEWDAEIDRLSDDARVHYYNWVREQTIRECIEKVKCMGGRLDDMLERKRVISALEDLSNHSDMGIPISDPVRELRNNYKCGEEYMKPVFGQDAISRRFSGIRKRNNL